MRRLCALVLGFCAVVPAGAEANRAQLIELAGSVLKVEAERADGGYSLGSGVVIGAERVVTNCHVTRDARRIDLLHGGARWYAAAQLRDAEHDLCLLRVPGLKARPVPLAQADLLKRGQRLAALGYTGGTTIQYSSGEVVALHRLDGGRVIQSSNWFNSGASGGGLFDESLNLVGILTFRLRGAESHYFAAPAAWLSPLLEEPIANYGAIAPDSRPQPPYWQRAAASQPRFLQAGSMERDGRWPALQALALEWTHADAHDPEPWYWLGEALQRQNKPAAARHALECSLAIEPDSNPARALLDPPPSSPAPASSASADAVGAGQPGPAPAVGSTSIAVVAAPCAAEPAARLTR